jgi:predicted transcriptional regulator
MFFTEKQAIEAIRLYPHLTTKMKLSGQALDVYLHVRVLKEGATTLKISTTWGVTVQHANVILKSLVKKGYLERSKSPQKSGGYEFVYTVK